MYLSTVFVTQQSRDLKKKFKSIFTEGRFLISTSTANIDPKLSQKASCAVL